MIPFSASLYLEAFSLTKIELSHAWFHMEFFGNGQNSLQFLFLIFLASFNSVPAKKSNLCYRLFQAFTKS